MEKYSYYANDLLIYTEPKFLNKTIQEVNENTKDYQLDCWK